MVKENMQVLKAAYRLNNHTGADPLPRDVLLEILHSCLVLLKSYPLHLFEKPINAEVDPAAYDFYNNLMISAQQNPDQFHIMEDFTLEIVNNMSSSGIIQNTQKKKKKLFSYEEVKIIYEELFLQFGRLENIYCQDMKAELRSLDRHLTGRVSLKAFYSQPAGHKYWFAESPKYLHKLGIIDPTDVEMPHVMSVSYVDGPCNCIMHTEEFKLCCISECSGLYRKVEAEIQAPSAGIERIIQVMEKVTGKPIPDIFVDILIRVAKQSRKGQIQVHGRLFAQWLHYLEPYKCRYPSLVKGEMNTPKLLAQTRQMEAFAQSDWESKIEPENIPDLSLWSDIEVLPFEEPPDALLQKALQTFGWDAGEQATFVPTAYLYTALSLAAGTLFAVYFRCGRRGAEAPKAERRSKAKKKKVPSKVTEEAEDTDGIHEPTLRGRASKTSEKATPGTAAGPRERKNSKEEKRLAQLAQQEAEARILQAQLKEPILEAQLMEQAVEAQLKEQELIITKAREKEDEAEAARRAQEAELAEVKKAEEARAAEEARIAAAVRQAEEDVFEAAAARREEDAAKAEEAEQAIAEAMRVAEAKRAEEARQAQKAAEAKAQKAREARMAEAAKLAEEAAKKIEEARKAEEAQKAEQARKAEQAKKLEENKKAEAKAIQAEEKIRREAEKAEEVRKAEERIKALLAAEETRRAEERIKAEAERAKEEARTAQEIRKAYEAKHLSLSEAEKIKKSEHMRKAEEFFRAEEVRKAEEAKKAERIRKAEEAKRLEETTNAEATESEEPSNTKGKKTAEAEKAEDVRIAEKAKKMEEAGKTSDLRKSTDAEKAEDTKRAEPASKSEETKQAEETRITPKLVNRVEESEKAEAAKKAEDAETAGVETNAEETKPAKDAEETTLPKSSSLSEDPGREIARLQGSSPKEEGSAAQNSEDIPGIQGAWAKRLAEGKAKKAAEEAQKVEMAKAMQNSPKKRLLPLPPGRMAPPPPVPTGKLEEGKAKEPGLQAPGQLEEISSSKASSLKMRSEQAQCMEDGDVKTVTQTSSGDAPQDAMIIQESPCPLPVSNEDTSGAKTTQGTFLSEAQSSQNTAQATAIDNLQRALDRSARIADEQRKEEDEADAFGMGLFMAPSRVLGAVHKPKPAEKSSAVDQLGGIDAEEALEAPSSQSSSSLASLLERKAPKPENAQLGRHIPLGFMPSREAPPDSKKSQLKLKKRRGFEASTREDMSPPPGFSAPADMQRPPPMSLPQGVFRPPPGLIAPSSSSWLTPENPS